MHSTNNHREIENESEADVIVAAFGKEGR